MRMIPMRTMPARVRKTLGLRILIIKTRMDYKKQTLILITKKSLKE